jgi:hypothetical protein
MPLYRPPYRHRIVLDYGDRIPNGDYVELSKEAPEQSAQAVVKFISDDLPKVEHVHTPHDFIDYLGPMIEYQTPHALLDVGLTYALTGRVELALENFERLAARTTKRRAWVTANREPEPYRSAAARKDARSTALDLQTLDERLCVANDLVARLKSNPASITERTQAWEAENIALLGLAKTVSNAGVAA